MASKRDLLLVRLAIKWKWLDATQGEDVLFLKRKFGSKLTVEQIIRRRGYLAWDEIDQLAEAANAQTGRRAGPAIVEEVTDASVRVAPPSAERKRRPRAIRAPLIDKEEVTDKGLKQSLPQAPMEDDQGDKTMIAPMPELMKAAMARIDALEQANRGTDRADVLDPLSTIMDDGPTSFDPHPLVVPSEMDEPPREHTVFDPRPDFFDEAGTAGDGMDAPTVEHEAYQARPSVTADNLFEGVGDSAVGTFSQPDSMPGEPLAELMLDRQPGKGLTIDEHAKGSLTIVRDEAGDEQLEGDFGPYVIRRVLAKGDRSTVYLAGDKVSDPGEPPREVALKVLNLNPVQGARFFVDRGDELLKAAKLVCPEVARILDVGRVQNRYFVALQYVDGWTLQDMLDVGDRPTYAQVAEIGRDLAGALMAAEALDILHLDIRPDHVLISETGQALLSGFGLAPEHPGVDPTQKIRGAYPYMAPEQLLGQPSLHSDIYGVGATLYRVLTGKAPFGDAVDRSELAQKLVESPPVDPRAIDPSVPPPLAELVLRLLAKRPTARFESARELQEAFEQIIFDMEAGGFADAPASHGPRLQPLLLKAVGVSVALIALSIFGPSLVSLLSLSPWSASEAALNGAMIGMAGLIAASLLLSTIALIRRGQIPLPPSSVWLVRAQESAGVIGALCLVAGFVLAPPAAMNVVVGVIAVILLGSGVFGALLRRAVAAARADGGVGRILAVLSDPLLSRWRTVHVPLIACATALATARFAVMAYFASA